MKSEVVFGLDDAGWPALLVDAAGVISCANPAAVRFFGPVLEAKPATWPALWRLENKITAHEFFAGAGKAAAASGGLKFARQDGNVVSMTASVCAVTHADQRCFLVQLFPESAERLT